MLSCLWKNSVSARSSETSVNFYQTTQRLISQDGNLEVVPLVLISEDVTAITIELGKEVSILLQVENKKRDNQLQLIRRRTYRNSVLVVFPPISYLGRVIFESQQRYLPSWLRSCVGFVRIIETNPRIVHSFVIIHNLYTNGTPTEMIE
jgi:hypothetical protein